MHSTEKELILDNTAIQHRILEMGEEISRDYQNKELLVVGVLKGAFIFMADLIRAVSIPLTIDFIQVSSYDGGSDSSGSITLKNSPGHPIKDTHILLVEDIIDTGLTMRWLVDYFTGQGAASVRVCSLIDKAERREHKTRIDYIGFSIAKGFLVGYGLDYDEKFRNLPAIHHLKL